jgi:hypothetical protein
MLLNSYLIKTFNLNPDPKKYSAVDSFKLLGDFDLYQSALRVFKDKFYDKTTLQEKYLIDTELDPGREIVHRLSYTHFCGWFSEIYSVISNPDLVHSEVFKILNKNISLLSKMTDCLIKLFDDLDRPIRINDTDIYLYKFFDPTIIKKYIDSIDFTEYLTQSDISNKKLFRTYLFYCKAFQNQISKLKKYLHTQLLDPKYILNKSNGLGQFPSAIYEYFFEYHIGLGTRIDFDQIRAWAQTHLKGLETQLSTVCDRIIDSSNDFNLGKKCVIVNSQPNQKFTSKLDMEQSYVSAMNSYRKIFIEDYLFVEHIVPVINTFDSGSSDAFYYQNTFYLNTSNWKHSPRSDINSLVLHEVIPGHHLQTEYSSRSNQGLIPLIYEIRFSGYAEGWALFAEEFQEMNSDYDLYGYLQSQILRTYRIIGEIDLHVKNKPISEVISDARLHLFGDILSIESEVYRWAMFPGQASSYKTGAEVFKTVIKKKFGSENYLATSAVQFYKDMLGIGEQTLGVVLDQTNTKFNFEI